MAAFPDDLRLMGCVRARVKTEPWATGVLMDLHSELPNLTSFLGSEFLQFLSDMSKKASSVTGVEGCLRHFLRGLGPEHTPVPNRHQ